MQVRGPWGVRETPEDTLSVRRHALSAHEPDGGGHRDAARGGIGDRAAVPPAPSRKAYQVRHRQRLGRINRRHATRHAVRYVAQTAKLSYR